jgi:hypothetical protein
MSEKSMFNGDEDLRGKIPNNHEDVERAISDIRYIKDVMNASKDFFLSGWPGVAWGIAILLGTFLTALILKHPPKWDLSGTIWSLWIVLGAMASGVEIFYFFRGTHEAGKPILSPLPIKIFLAEFLMTVEGLILTLLFIQTKMTAYIPGAWLLSIGTSLTVAGFFIPGGIWVFGLVSFVVSIIALILPEMGLFCLAFTGLVTLCWGIVYLIVRRR